MQLWDNFISEQEQEFGKETVDRWLRTLIVKKFDACNIYLEAQDSFQTLWFDEHIRPKLASLVNNNQKNIKVHVALTGKSSSSKKAPKKNTVSNSASSGFAITFEDLDPSCTLDEFLVTDENMIAFRVLQEVVSRLVSMRVHAMSSFEESAALCLPQDAMNPIYLYGPSGSGKTHLLMAIANKLKSMGYQAIYARAELFTDHVIKAIRAGEMTLFRSLYRQADVLIIDDVHTLARKAATQEEFFHTFNALHTSCKQIILSANCAPQQLQAIEPRLISRFEWGIVLALQTLQPKDMVKLLEKKAKFFNLLLPPRSCEFLVESFPTNPKSLIKALEALMLRSHLSQQNALGRQAPILLSVNHVKSLLTDLIEEEKSKVLTPQKVVQAVAEYYGITQDDITGKSQARECVVPRKVSMYLCREHLKIPFLKIGDHFSRDHSTVMSSIKYIQKQLTQESSDIASAVQIIELKLQQEQAPYKTTT